MLRSYFKEVLVLENSLLVDYEYEPSERKLPYDFDELQGIILGSSVKNPSNLEIWIGKEIL